ncbi:hypothetical protein BC952_2236 [Flavobacterium limicola]|uniref:Uncharacterized protein n=1 Tax=Flavobacterium limicola TaxID=180441 RepID=A0A495RXY5_9FLAO|nr:hypothetical protein BC952_2236 [Flavobacterium limicola]
MSKAGTIATNKLNFSLLKNRLPFLVLTLLKPQKLETSCK